MSNEVKFEDLNKIFIQLSELRVSYNELSMQLRFIEENTKKISEHSDKINEMHTAIELINKDLKILNNDSTYIDEEIGKNLANLHELSEKYQELQGQINQVIVSVNEIKTEKKEGRSDFKRIILFPLISTLLAGVIMLGFGYIFNKVFGTGQAVVQQEQHVNN